MAWQVIAEKVIFTLAMTTVALVFPFVFVRWAIAGRLMIRGGLYLDRRTAPLLFWFLAVIFGGVVAYLCLVIAPLAVLKIWSSADSGFADPRQPVAIDSQQPLAHP